MRYANIIIPYFLYYFPMETRNIIGKRLKQARHNSKSTITQEELIAKLQVMDVSIDRSMISKIENGIRPVYDYEVIALAKALKVKAAWLLGEE